jgi:hypothetical protein
LELKPTEQARNDGPAQGSSPAGAPDPAEPSLAEAGPAAHGLLAADPTAEPLGGRPVLEYVAQPNAADRPLPRLVLLAGLALAVYLLRAYFRWRLHS